MSDPFKTNENLLPEPHASFAGTARGATGGKRDFASIAKLWQPRGTSLEPAAATVSRYAMRLIDLKTGMAYDAQELFGRVPTVDFSGTALTLDAGHNGKMVNCTSASAVTVTVPAGLPAEFNCGFIRSGSGTVQVTGSGVTVNAAGGLSLISPQHATASLMRKSDGSFNLSGSLA